MNEPRWISLSVVMAIHEAQLAEHGGSTGVRDAGLLDSALARPRQVYACVEAAGLVRVAAAYAFGIAKNQTFLDGNKRTAWVVCATFLELNGRRITASQVDVVGTMLGVADGSVNEDSFVVWLELNSR